ncbi:helix-turn-helix transcriptional regulator [Nocardia miyunensis]|uniref:helix-turn-helix transcriptional regulator n=1 Tax=Nocardia miyunensis TaxID=282684 RepID=UPI000834D606|nr:AAA family ATPase [Nocardia miyunensis]
MAGRTGSIRLVGRQGDFARISAVAEQAAAGRGGIVVITGEPGIGKTSLLNAVSELASTHGARLLRGTATEIEQEVPYAALGWCLGFGHGTPDPSAAQLHSLLRGTDLPGDGAFSRHFAVVEALLALLDQWCTASPVILILDDANWADPASLAALERLGEIVTELPLMIVMAIRPLPRGESLAALLKQFHAWGAAQLQLKPLTEPEVATLIEDTLGAVPGPALTAAVAGAGGNPFYVVELVAGLRQADALTAVGRGITELATAPAGQPERFPLPESLTETVERRLDFLPRTARHVLTMAAALGTSVEAMELSTVLDLAVMEIWEAISIATEAGLLVKSGDELIFRHDLLRQVFADQVPTSARTSLQLRAGRVLIAAGAPAERIANYLLAGDAPLDDQSLRWLAETADTLTVRAPELAINLLAGVVAGSGSDHAAHENFRVQHVRALLWSGRAAEAETTAKAVLASRTPTAPGSANDKALRWLLVRAYYAQGRLDDAATTANLVLAQPGLTQWEEGLYNSFLALFYFFDEKFDVAEQAATRAISIGDELDDPLTVGLGCTTLGGLRYTQGYLDQALALGERVAAAYETCQRSGNRLDQLDPYVLRAHSLIELDRPAEAEEVLGRAVVDGLQNRGLHLVSRARLYFLSGRWDDALAEILARQGLPDIFGHGVVTNSMTALIAVHRGTFDAGLNWAGPDDRVGSQTYLHFDSWVDALLLESRGRPSEALAILAEACRKLASGLAGSTVYYAYPDVARLAVACGNRQVLDEISTAAQALDARYSTLSRRGTVLLCRGLSLDQPELLEQSAQAFHGAGRPLYEGQAREELAVILARQGRTADARSALDAAIRSYAGMDAQWDISRAESRLREHGVRRGSRGPRKRPKTGWQALTPTEQKVAELVAQGGSNSEIATRMFLSRRTVQTHVSSILNKLSLQSRVQVAVSLARQA